MSTFDELNLSSSLKNALNDLGYIHPTTIQEKAFSVILSGKNVVGIAQTGTGKTFAYLLPCLRQWVFSKDKNPQMLILVPTRELVVQVVEEVVKLTKYMNIRVLGVYGGTNINTQKGQCMEGTDVLVATPGRLIDLCLSGTVKLKLVKKFIIDEVDEMLSLGFRTQLIQVMDFLPAKRQHLLFSATITEEVDTFIQANFIETVTIEAAPTGTPLSNISQVGYQVPNFMTKLNLLALLLSKEQDMKKVIVFVSTKERADKVAEKLEGLLSISLGCIHSSKAQNHRLNSVKRFQEGFYRVLIATDLVARGLDISEVSHVINFDIPSIPENYIHRIGRTGRADEKGESITFSTLKEDTLLEVIETLMNYTIPFLPLPEALEISDELIEEEKIVVFQKIIEPKIRPKEQGGEAFHEKSEKNKKVNNKIRRDESLKIKYKKSKSIRGKKR